MRIFNSHQQKPKQNYNYNFCLIRGNFENRNLESSGSPVRPAQKCSINWNSENMELENMFVVWEVGWLGWLGWVPAVWNDFHSEESSLLFVINERFSIFTYCTKTVSNVKYQEIIPDLKFVWWMISFFLSSNKFIHEF